MLRWTITLIAFVVFLTACSTADVAVQESTATQEPTVTQESVVTSDSATTTLPTATIPASTGVPTADAASANPGTCDDPAGPTTAVDRITRLQLPESTAERVVDTTIEVSCRLVARAPLASGFAHHAAALGDGTFATALGFTMTVWDADVLSALQNTELQFNVTTISEWDEGQLLIGGSTGEVGIWNANTGLQLMPFTEGTERITSLAAMGTNYVVATNSLGLVTIWETGQSGAPTAVHSLAFGSDDGALEVAPLDASSVLLWSWHELAILHADGSIVTVDRSDGTINDAASIGNDKIAYMSQGRRMRIVSDGQVIEIDDPEHGGTGSRLMVLPDGRLVTSGFLHGPVLTIWDNNTYMPRERIRGLQARSVIALSGNRLAGVGDNHVAVWNLDRPEVPIASGLHNQLVRGLHVIDDEAILSIDRAGIAGLWTAADPGKMETFELFNSTESQETLFADMDVAADGSVLAASIAGQLSAWSPTTGTVRRDINTIGVTRDIARIGASSLIAEGCTDFRFFADMTGESQAVDISDEYAHCIDTIAMLDDRHFALLIGGAFIMVFDTNDLSQPEHSRPPRSVFDSSLLTTLADGRLVADSAGGDIGVWELASDELDLLMEHGETISSLLVLPNGNLVSASASTLKVWDLSTGQAILELPLSLGLVGPMQAAPNGDVVVSIGHGWLRLDLTP